MKEHAAARSQSCVVTGSSPCILVADWLSSGRSAFYFRWISPPDLLSALCTVTARCNHGGVLETGRPQVRRAGYRTRHRRVPLSPTSLIYICNPESCDLSGLVKRTCYRRGGGGSPEKVCGNPTSFPVSDLIPLCTPL